MNIDVLVDNVYDKKLIAYMRKTRVSGSLRLNSAVTGPGPGGQLKYIREFVNLQSSNDAIGNWSGPEEDIAARLPQMSLKQTPALTFSSEIEQFKLETGMPTAATKLSPVDLEGCIAEHNRSPLLLGPSFHVSDSYLQQTSPLLHDSISTLTLLSSACVIVRQFGRTPQAQRQPV
jgi:hypothetical protein